MSVTATERKKPLGVRVTAEQHQIISEAAKREHRSVSSFVLKAAMTAAQPSDRTGMRLTDEEAVSIVKHAQDAFRASSDSHRNLIEELFAERRADAIRG